MFMANIKSKYQSLPESFRAMVSKIRYFALLAYQLLAYRLRWLLHPTHPLREIHSVNKEINEKINRGYFSDRLVIVASLPKSASEVIAHCALAIQSNFGPPGTGINLVEEGLSNIYAPSIRLELVQALPYGGVWKHHPKATGGNLRVLDRLGVKYIITVRHPADQLAAIYCQILRKRPIPKEVIERDEWVDDDIHAMKLRLFQDGVNLNETIGCMIREGYLNATLSWITDWLHFRDVNKSLVIRYEDFATNQVQTLNNISNFLYGRELDEKTLAKCNSAIEKFTTKQNVANTTRRYPRGWTGNIGIWKSYFSDENKKDYLSVVSGFLNYYPHASLLMDVYPNLLDIDDFKKLAIESIALTLNGEES